MTSLLAYWTSIFVCLPWTSLIDPMAPHMVHDKPPVLMRVNEALHNLASLLPHVTPLPAFSPPGLTPDFLPVVP